MQILYRMMHIAIRYLFALYLQLLLLPHQNYLLLLPLLLLLSEVGRGIWNKNRCFERETETNESYILQGGAVPLRIHFVNTIKELLGQAEIWGNCHGKCFPSHHGPIRR